MTTRILKYLVLLAFVLLIISISSFWFGGPSFRERDVIVELEGPTQAATGDEIFYKLKYSNETRSVLEDLDFVFYYPQGSTVIVDGVANEDYSEDFTIEKLEPGEKGEKEFSAFLLGEKGNIKVAKAILTFKTGNLNSIFEKSVSLSTTIVSTPIALTLVAPPTTNSNQSVNYILDYRNESDEDATDLIFEFDYPDGFKPQNFSPNPDEGNNIWKVKNLKKGNGSRISIEGRIEGREGESKVISVNLRRKVGSEYVDYQRSSARTQISNPILGIDLLVNNSKDYSSSLGDRLAYTIQYANNSNFNLLGVYVSAKLEGEMFDYGNLDTRGGFFDDATKTITWDASAIPEFNNLEPNKKGQISFGIALKPFFSSSTEAARDRFVKVTAKFGTPNVPESIDAPELAVAGVLITKIGTQPTFNQSASYNDSSFGSAGPLPPRVGEETFFTIHWQLTNPGNDIGQAKVSARLPAGVVWTDVTRTNASGATLVYNANSSEVVWNVGTLPFGVGIGTPKYEASFRVKVKPSSTQKGGPINFFETIQFTGVDNFTKQNVVINGNQLTSDNLSDRPREGTVQ